MAYITRILSTMASQISFGRTVESGVSCSYSETATNYVRTNVSRIKNKYVLLINLTFFITVNN